MLFDDPNSWDALCKIMQEVLNDRSLRETFLIIDGLDECDGDLGELLAMIERLYSHPRVKVLVSSRNWPNIERALKPVPQQVQLKLELNSAAISAAVRTYVNIKVGQIWIGQGFDNTNKDQVINYLCSKADDTFLWVALVCDELAHPESYDWDVQRLLHSLPSGLYPLYERMLNQIFSQRQRDVCREIIAIICCVYRPISVAELSSLVELPSGPAGNVDIIIGLCRSFLTLRGGSIYFVHQSAKDFLLQEQSSRILPLGLRQQHHMIFLRSLEALFRILKRNMYNLPSPGTRIKNFIKPDHDPLAPIYYACVRWVDHLLAAGPAMGVSWLPDDGRAHQFLKAKFLYWLEALGLMSGISEGVLAMRKLQGLAAESQGIECLGVRRWVEDGLRFVLMFRNGIELAPLQVYSSALLFSPMLSIVRQTFEEKIETPNWILSKKPAVAKHWERSLQTLALGSPWLTDLAILPPDGNRLVACGTTVLKIWNLAMGACVREIEPPGLDKNIHFTTVAGLPDGSQIVTGSSNGEIQIWDIDSGMLLRRFQGHTWDTVAGEYSQERIVISLATALRRPAIASSLNGTIKIWDPSTGTLIHSLETRLGAGRLAFSPDGRRLASAGRRSPVVIWDAVKGSCIRVLDKDWIDYHITYSPDGTCLALSGSSGVSTWDTRTYQRTGTIYEGSSNLVAFLSNNRLIYHAGKKVMHLWDGQHRRTLRCRFEVASKLVSSPHSNLLASGMICNSTIKVWDADDYETVGEEASGDTREERFHALTISSDGCLVATASQASINLWDASTWKRIKKIILSPPVSDCKAIAFIPSSDYIALVDSSAVGIWDRTSGAKLLSVYADPAQSRPSIEMFSTYSPDGRHLACTSGEHVTIYSLTDGTYWRTQHWRSYPSHDFAATALEFSPDSRLLLWGDPNKKVTIWDTATRTYLYLANTDSIHITWVPWNVQRIHTHHATFYIQLHVRAGITTGIWGPHLDISSDGAWLTRFGELVLWLPPKYRPRSITVCGNTVAFIYDSGRFLGLQFSLSAGSLE